VITTDASETQVATMEWSLERSEQFVDTMRIMLAGYDQDPSARYPTTIEQTARCLNALPKEQAESALRDFSKSAREAVQVMQRKLAEGIITSTPSIDKSIRRTPYRTPSRSMNMLLKVALINIPTTIFPYPRSYQCLRMKLLVLERFYNLHLREMRWRSRYNILDNYPACLLLAFIFLFVGFQWR